MHFLNVYFVVLTTGVSSTFWRLLYLLYECLLVVVAEVSSTVIFVRCGIWRYFYFFLEVLAVVFITGIFAYCCNWMYFLKVCLLVVVAGVSSTYMCVSYGNEDINTLTVRLCSYSSNISIKEKKGIFCKWTLMYNFNSIEISSFCFKWFIGYTVPHLFDASVMISEFTINSVRTNLWKSIQISLMYNLGSFIQ